MFRKRNIALDLDRNTNHMRWLRFMIRVWRAERDAGLPLPPARGIGFYESPEERLSATVIDELETRYQVAQQERELLLREAADQIAYEVTSD